MREKIFVQFDHIRSKKAKATIFSLALLMFILLAACSPQSDLTVGDRAPEFSIPDANGQMVSLSEINSDQPVLLFFHMAGG